MVVVAGVSGFIAGSVASSNVFHYRSRGDEAIASVVVAVILFGTGLLISRRNASLGNTFVFIAMGVAAVVRCWP
jgi:hypothetical protein